MISSEKPNLLIVDDHEDIRSQMKWALAHDYEVLIAQDGPSAIEVFKRKLPLITLLDLGLPPHPASPVEGLATLSNLLAVEPSAKILIVSGQGEKKNALQAIGLGAYDFITKPVDIDELKIILKRAFHVGQLERENRQIKERLTGDAFEGMIGSSPQMQQVFSTIRRVATTD